MGTLDERLKKTIRQDIQSTHAYAIQNSAGLVKLDAMENPHRLSPELQVALGQRLGALALNRYPDNRVDDLRRARCPRHGRQSCGASALRMKARRSAAISSAMPMASVVGALVMVSAATIDRNSTRRA